MGAWNFGTPQVTEGVKIIAECECDDTECGCYDLLDWVEKEKKFAFESIEATIRRRLNEDFSIEIIVSPYTRIIHGYYDGVAIDYDEDRTLGEVTVVYNHDGTTVVIDTDEEEEAFYELLPEEYCDVPFNIVNGREYTDIPLCDLQEDDKGLLYGILREHANAAFPPSCTVGWVTERYEAECVLPEPQKGMEIISMFCRLKGCESDRYRLDIPKK